MNSDLFNLLDQIIGTISESPLTPNQRSTFDNIMMVVEPSSGEILIGLSSSIAPPSREPLNRAQSRTQADSESRSRRRLTFSSFPADPANSVESVNADIASFLQNELEGYMANAPAA